MDKHELACFVWIFLPTHIFSSLPRITSPCVDETFSLLFGAIVKDNNNKTKLQCASPTSFPNLPLADAPTALYGWPSAS